MSNNLDFLHIQLASMGSVLPYSWSDEYIEIKYLLIGSSHAVSICQAKHESRLRKI